MDLRSPKAALFNALVERLSSLDQVRYTDMDFGQLDNYASPGRPPVSWPCCLINMDEWGFTEMQGHNRQIGTGFVSLRIAQVQWSSTNNLTQPAIRERGLAYFETEQAIHEALQGWAPNGFSRMLRRSSVLEQRDDDIRVTQVRYYISYDDSTTQPAYTSVARPGAVPMILNEPPA